MTAPRATCSRRHGKICNPWHAQLVIAYRAERLRQEDALEAITGGYRADADLLRDRGLMTLTDFKQWLKANRSGHEQEAS